MAKRAKKRRGGPGGRRPGAGRPQQAKGFRQWCRDVVERPEVRRKMERLALDDPEFALRLAEHGYGRPPQALDLKVGGDAKHPLTYRAVFDDGSPVPSAAAALSAAVAGGPSS